MDLLINDKVSAQISGGRPDPVLLHSLLPGAAVSTGSYLGSRRAFASSCPELPGIRRLAGGAGRLARGRRDGRRGLRKLRLTKKPDPAR